MARHARALTARQAAVLALALALAGCGSGSRASAPLRFWAMGREGEVVSELTRDFTRETGIRVDVQQIPWSAAHEKLLTAFVGRSTPDLAQLGNTWIPEFRALHALEPLGERQRSSSAVPDSAYFPGIWDTNLIDGTLYGVPWYVDTRLMFYRRDVLARAGYSRFPDTWEGWRACMVAVRRTLGSNHYAMFFPLNEWNVPIILGLQEHATLLRDDDTRGDFSSPEFRRAFEFYESTFRDSLAPPLSGSEVANLFQEFERAYFVMYVTGPWNLGEFARRLPPSLANAWATAPMPGPTGAASGLSLAGGSSLVIFHASHRQSEAWKLIEFLSRPDIQLRFYRACGDLPARREAWRDPALAGDPRLGAFRVQLERVVPTPKVPEWEQIVTRVQDHMERAARGRVTPDSALAALDRDVDRILEKRRWLVERARRAEGGARVGAAIAPPAGGGR
jgi:multiple sugar transport system substrate-binding protein